MSVGRVLGDNVRLFGLIANTLAKDKEIEDDWRGYRTPQAARHLPTGSRRRWWTR